MPNTITIDISTPNQLAITVAQDGVAPTTQTTAVPNGGTFAVQSVSNGVTALGNISVQGGSGPDIIVNPAYPTDALKANFNGYYDAGGFVDPIKFMQAKGYAIATIGTNVGNEPDFPTAQGQLQGINKPIGVVFPRGQKISAKIQGTDNVESPGFSPMLPTFIVASGDVANPRPILSLPWMLGGKREPANLFIAGFDFSAATVATEAAIRMVTGAFSNVWCEDNNVTGLFGGLEFQCTDGANPFTSLIVRRNTVVGVNQNRWACYILGIKDALLEENFLDACGWDGQNTASKGPQQQTVYRQKYAYTGTTLARNIGNIYARASADGAQNRDGGLDQDSSFLFCPIAGFVGPTGDTPNYVRPFVDAGGGEFDLSCGPNQPRGQGIALNAVLNGTITDALLVNRPASAGPNSFAIDIQCPNSDTGVNVPTNATLTNCIAYNWASNNPLQIDGTPGTITKVNCDLTGSGKYKDPTRTTARYSREVMGYSTTVALLAAMAKQRRGNWDKRLTSVALQTWVRAGFVVA